MLTATDQLLPQGVRITVLDYIVDCVLNLPAETKGEHIWLQNAVDGRLDGVDEECIEVDFLTLFFHHSEEVLDSFHPVHHQTRLRVCHRPLEPLFEVLESVFIF